MNLPTTITFEWTGETASGQSSFLEGGALPKQANLGLLGNGGEGDLSGNGNGSHVPARAFGDDLDALVARDGEAVEGKRRKGSTPLPAVTPSPDPEGTNALQLHPTTRGNKEDLNDSLGIRPVTNRELQEPLAEKTVLAEDKIAQEDARETSLREVNDPELERIDYFPSTPSKWAGRLEATKPPAVEAAPESPLNTQDRGLVEDALIPDTILPATEGNSVVADHSGLGGPEFVEPEPNVFPRTTPYIEDEAFRSPVPDRSVLPVDPIRQGIDLSRLSQRASPQGELPRREGIVPENGRPVAASTGPSEVTIAPAPASEKKSVIPASVSHSELKTAREQALPQSVAKQLGSVETGENHKAVDAAPKVLAAERTPQERNIVQRGAPTIAQPAPVQSKAALPVQQPVTNGNVAIDQTTDELPEGVRKERLPGIYGRPLVSKDSGQPLPEERIPRSASEERDARNSSRETVREYHAGRQQLTQSAGAGDLQKVRESSFVEGFRPPSATTAGTIMQVQAATGADNSQSEQRKGKDSKADSTQIRMDRIELASTSSNGSIRSTGGTMAAASQETFIKVMETVERYQSSADTNRIQLQLDLEGGDELKVLLKFAKGHMNAAFLTESDSLRLAMREGWEAFQKQLQEKGIVSENPNFPDFRDGEHSGRNQKELWDTFMEHAAQQVFAGGDSGNGPTEPGSETPKTPLQAPRVLNVYA